MRRKTKFLIFFIMVFISISIFSVTTYADGYNKGNVRFGWILKEISLMDHSIIDKTGNVNALTDDDKEVQSFLSESIAVGIYEKGDPEYISMYEKINGGKDFLKLCYNYAPLASGLSYDNDKCRSTGLYRAIVSFGYVEDDTHKIADKDKTKYAYFEFKLSNNKWALNKIFIKNNENYYKIVAKQKELLKEHNDNMKELEDDKKESLSENWRTFLSDKIISKIVLLINHLAYVKNPLISKIFTKIIYVASDIAIADFLSCLLSSCILFKSAYELFKIYKKYEKINDPKSGKSKDERNKALREYIANLAAFALNVMGFIVGFSFPLLAPLIFGPLSIIVKYLIIAYWE